MADPKEQGDPSASTDDSYHDPHLGPVVLKLKL